MKSLFTLLFTALISSFFAQNYEAFQSNHQYHYTQSIGSREYIFSVKMDSIEIMGSDTVLRNYLQVPVFPADLPNYTLNYKCLGRESWTGKISYKRASSIHEFVTATDDTIKVKTNALLGETWVFCPNGSTNYFEAEITDVYQTSVLGVMDSVKEITLNLYDQSHVLQTSNFNGKKLLLSKNYGLIQLYDFYNFPNEFKEFVLIGKDAEGNTPLKEEELYQFEVDDYLVYLSMSTGITDFRVITSKTVGVNSYTYNFKQIIKFGGTYTYNAAATEVYNFTPDNYRLMGQYENFADDVPYPFDGVTVNFIENGKKYLNSHYVDPFDGMCWSEDLYNGRSATANFREGYGLLEDEVNAWNDALDEWGNPSTEYFTYHRELYYYVPVTGTSYGTLLKPFNYSMLKADKVKSCDGIIQFSIADLGYDSLVWHFGDGSISNEITPLHQYDTIGDYPVTLEIFSSFGNENFTFYTDIQVGNNTSDHFINISKKLTNACNTFLFKDLTDTVDTRIWTFPGGSTSTDLELTFTFDTAGIYSVSLFSTYGYCTGTRTIEVFVETINLPIAAACPITSDGYNLYYFEMDGKELKGSSPYTLYSNLLGDSLRRGCNFFPLNAGQYANVKLFTGSYELIDLGGGLFDPWYTGDEFSLWIDYNNDGIFQTTEKVTTGSCNDGYAVDIDELYGVSSFLVSDSAVKNQVLRMRLIDGISSDPCDEFLNRYDFSTMISDFTGVYEKELAKLFNVAPNPTQNKLTVKLNNPASIFKLELSLQNVLGEIVYTQSENQLVPHTTKSISMENLANGVYFLTISADDKSQTVKVVKE